MNSGGFLLILSAQRIQITGCTNEGEGLVQRLLNLQKVYRCELRKPVAETNRIATSCFTMQEGSSSA